MGLLIQTDSNGSVGGGTVAVTVNNVLSNRRSGRCHYQRRRNPAGSGSFTDPGADIFTARVDYGDGMGIQTLTLGGKEQSGNSTVEGHFLESHYERLYRDSSFTAFTRLVGFEERRRRCWVFFAFLKVVNA